MSPIVAYHATRSACRRSILQRGLLGNQPNKSRPFGVYVFNDDFGHGARHWVRWSYSHRQDLWRVTYIGPVRIDEYVTNGMILLDSPVTHVELIAGI